MGMRQEAGGHRVVVVTAVQDGGGAGCHAVRQ